MGGHLLVSGRGTLHGGQGSPGWEPPHSMAGVSDIAQGFPRHAGNPLKPLDLLTS
jgi:hypothetical protein